MKRCVDLAMLIGLPKLLLLFLIISGSSAANLENCRIDVVLVIDSSGSVRRVFNTYKEAALQFTKDLQFGPESAHAAVVQYSRLPPLLKYAFNYEQSNHAINKSISELEFLGDATYTAEAVNLGIDQFASGGRPDAKRVFVLMTDGNSINQWRVVQATAKRLSETQANVYVLGLGDNLYYPELNLYTGNGSLILRDGLDRFKSEVIDLGGCTPLTTPSTTVSPTVATTSRETVTFKPPFPSTTDCPIPAGWCPCPETTLSPPTEPPFVTDQPTGQYSPCAVDILFVLDSSGSDKTNFDRQLRFILDILDILVIRPDAHLVAAIVYDGHAKQRLQFSFTAFKDIQSLSKAVSALPFFGGSAATGEALKLADQALKDRRSRSVPALVFVLTNGTSDDDVTVPGALLRSEPNTEVYALSATDVTNKGQMTRISGSPDRVFAGMEAENIKRVGLGKYLQCFRDSLTLKQRRFL